MEDKELVEVWRKEFELMIGDENIKKNAKPFNAVGYSHLSPKEGSYRLPSIESMWQGFLLAKRSQPVIELTKKPKLTGIDSDYSKGILEGFNICRAVDVLSITDAGIKYTIKE